MHALSITWVDIAVMAVVVISAGFAFGRGLVHETFAILEWVAAAYVALNFTPSFQPLLQDYISPPWLEYAAVFVGTFLLVWIPLSMLSHRLEEAVKRSEIGPVDRALGLIFGVGRGLAIVGLAYILYAALVPAESRSAALTSARSYSIIRNSSEVLLELVPDTGSRIADLRGGGKKAGKSGKSRSGTDADSAPEETAKAGEETSKPAKTYGAKDRRALDNLFKDAGDGKGSSQ
jgi:membrane protein required for colicin V production